MNKEIIRWGIAERTCGVVRKPLAMNEIQHRRDRMLTFRNMKVLFSVRPEGELYSTNVKAWMS